MLIFQHNIYSLPSQIIKLIIKTILYLLFIFPHLRFIHQMCNECPFLSGTGLIFLLKNKGKTRANSRCRVECVCVCVCALSHSAVPSSATSWIAARRSSIYGVFRQEYWVDCHFLLGDPLDPEQKLHLLSLLPWQADSLQRSYLKGPHSGMNWHNISLKISQSIH